MLRIARLVEICERLRYLEDKLSQLGIPNKGDRVRAQTRRVQSLSESLVEGRSGESDRSLSDEEKRIVEWGFVELGQFSASLRALEKAKCDPPEEMILRALDGRLDPTEETPQTNNQGRDIMFEITLAGDLAEAGLRPVLGTEPDIVCDLDGQTLMIECKRVSSISSFPGSISRANRQLSARLKNRSLHGCGVMAFCVTPLFSRAEVPLRRAGENEAITAMNEFTEACCRKYQWGRIQSPRIAGVLFHLALPGWLGGSLFSTMVHIKIETIPNSRDGAVLHRLTKRLEAGRQ